MPTRSSRQFKSYMKPVARRVTIQKPVEKPKGSFGNTAADGFMRVNESTVRKIYK